MSDIDARIVALYQSGLSTYAVGRLVHYSHAAVWSRLKKCGVTPRPHPRWAYPRPTCAAGHALDGDNVRIDRRGHRVCRACEKERAARRRKAA